MEINKPYRAIPVSYTHLDVYKRQECTGLIPTPPINEAQAEAYTDIYTIPKPSKETFPSQQQKGKNASK